MTTYVTRWLHLCPTCKGLCRRDLAVANAPWWCDLCGVVLPVVELVEVPTGDEVAA